MSKDINSWELYLKTGIDIHNRKIFFGYLDGAENDDVGFESITVAIRAIDKMVAISNKQPIELHFTSYGGDPYQSLALVDKILESPCKFKFIGRGAVMSAATVIMAVCDERLLSKNSTVMLHDGSDGFDGKTTDMQIYVKEMERLQDAYNEIYALNSRFDKKLWDVLVRRDLYLTAEECVLLGLADKVISTPGRSKFRNRGKPSSTEVKKLGVLIKKLADRLKMPNLTSVELRHIEDEVQDIPEYDNTEQELKKLNDESKPE